MKYENALMTSTIASRTPPYHNVSRVRTDKVRRRNTEPGHPVGDAVARGQDENRHRDLPRVQGLEHAEPVLSRQHEVEDDQVVHGLAEREVERLRAVRRDLDGVALLAQDLAHEPRDFSIVFDDQDSHVAPPPGRPSAPIPTPRPATARPVADPETFLMCLSCTRHGVRSSSWQKQDNPDR
jgi:hypothetical protein